MNLLPFWVRAPRILAASGSGLRVDGGMARVHVVAEGRGWLRCEGISIFVNGVADVTLLVTPGIPSMRVTFSGLGGTARKQVEIPRGRVLAPVGAPTVAITGPTVDPETVRPRLSGALRPRPDRSLLTPPRSPQDRRT